MNDPSKRLALVLGLAVVIAAVLTVVLMGLRI